MFTVVPGMALDLVFLLFSLFLSAALEAVAPRLELGGRALRRALARLIDDPYETTSPTFPPEATADRFFGGEQCESYRRLGERIATAALAPGGGWSSPLQALRDLAALRGAVRPVGRARLAPAPSMSAVPDAA